jgi:hypothetical protein
VVRPSRFTGRGTRWGRVDAASDDDGEVSGDPPRRRAPPTSSQKERLIEATAGGEREVDEAGARVGRSGVLSRGIAGGYERREYLDSCASEWRRSSSPRGWRRPRAGRRCCGRCRASKGKGRRRRQRPMRRLIVKIARPSVHGIDREAGDRGGRWRLDRASRRRVKDRGGRV